LNEFFKIEFVKKSLNCFQYLAFSVLSLSYFYGIFGQITHPEPKTLEIGSKAPDFNLLGVNGKIFVERF
jgi:hypothetical protein